MATMIAILLELFCWLLERIDVPAKVTLNETVSLAKKFGATDSYRYINGVLDQVGLSLRPHELADS